MHEVLLQCRFDMQNLKGKSVTILKLLIRAIYCRQAETHSSIRFDSTSKGVGMLIFRNWNKSRGSILLQNGLILFSKSCPYKYKRFVNSKKVITNTRLTEIVKFSSNLKCIVEECNKSSDLHEYKTQLEYACQDYLDNFLNFCKNH